MTDTHSMCNPPLGAAETKSMDTSLCPLCGRDNECACAAACLDDAASCWCFHAAIPVELLNRIPPERRGITCVCPACVEAYYKEQRA